MTLPSTSETFSVFFKAHPEFLLSDQFDSYWAEPWMKSPAGGPRIAPDFVLQPAGNRMIPWNWNVVDLKRHDVQLLTSGASVMDLSNQVYRAVTQLRNYQRFFDDPRNKGMLEDRFGGVVPAPRLTAIIGRLPIDPESRELYSKLIRRIHDVQIRSYDEILDLRRANVERLVAEP